MTDQREARPLASRTDGLSVKDAAKQANVHVQTVYGWIRNGDLPVTRFGPNRGVYRIHPQDLQDVAGPR